MSIKLDGVTYSGLHVASLKRNFSVLDGENAGRVKTGAMVRDIIGTYYNYSIVIDSEQSDRATYDQFYQAITSPADSHTLVVPYAQTVLTFRAYVTQGADELISSYDGVNTWRNLTFNFIAMSPQRRP